tara:strand:- start:118 stop:828 length:711 start_codon:yes stop_codon:yes gene_type:complete
MKLSIIIPFRNESKNIENTLQKLGDRLKNIDYELVLVNDFSIDNSFTIVEKQKEMNPKISLYNNDKKGLGRALTLGIEKSKGEAVCIIMADLSDDIEDLKTYYELIQEEGVDAIFGSRFIKGSKVNDYPLRKLILNRIFNYFTKIVFLTQYNDFTNAFKIYKKKSLLKTFPLVSESFNIFLELPLKIISRKMKYKIIPISWKNRKEGKSKFVIKELRSKYLFTLLYCLFEKILLIK